MSGDSWRGAAIQLLAAAESFIAHDEAPHTATDQLCNWEHFRGWVRDVRAMCDRLAAAECIRPRGKSWVERMFLAHPGSVTWVDDLEEHNSRVVALDAGRHDEPRFWILAEELLERERQARDDFMHAVGMV